MAITITAAELRVELGIDDDTAGNARATKLLTVASALVNQEGAEDAPSAVANEGATLTAGYLQENISGRVASLKIGTGLSFTFNGIGSAVRLSGARTMLSPWRVRDLPEEPED